MLGPTLGCALNSWWLPDFTSVVVWLHTFMFYLFNLLFSPFFLDCFYNCELCTMWWHWASPHSDSPNEVILKYFLVGFPYLANFGPFWWKWQLFCLGSFLGTHDGWWEMSMRLISFPNLTWPYKCLGGPLGGARQEPFFGEDYFLIQINSGFNYH